MFDLNQTKAYCVDSCSIGVNQYVTPIDEFLYLNTFTMGSMGKDGDEFEAAVIQFSEAYTGSCVGTGLAWKDEICMSSLLAIAQSLAWDYNLGQNLDH